MNSEPSSDCVAMKDELQRQVREENAGLTWEQRNALVRARLAEDPFMAKLLDAESIRTRATGPENAA